MLTQNILLVSLAACVLADPVPRPAPQQMSATPSFHPVDPAISSMYASLYSIDVILASFPTLPASAKSYLQTAVPTMYGIPTDECAYITSTPGWFASAPAYVKSALTSYDSAIVSWYVAHSTGLGVDISGASILTGSYSTYLPPTTCGGGAVNTGSAETSATGSSAGKATGSSRGSSTGAAATKSTGSSNTASGSGTATGTAAASTGSSAAAPRNRGVVLGFAGVFGVLGLMAAL